MLLTLSGGPGVGKTAVACELARRLAREELGLVHDPIYLNMQDISDPTVVFSEDRRSESTSLQVLSFNFFCVCLSCLHCALLSSLFFAYHVVSHVRI